jgi:hypothetical protein
MTTAMDCNARLAKVIREVHKLREASYDKARDRYTRRHDECIREIVGDDDPIALILSCLFTAGFGEMWDFCDHVLSADRG